MSTLSRRTSLLIARAGFAVVVLSFTGFAIWTAGDLLGQAPAQKKPRMEEEEDTPKAKAAPNKPKRKVIRVEEEEDSKAKPANDRPNAPAASGDLNQLAEQATQPSIKKLFHSLAHPYDLLVYKRKSSVTVNGEEAPREVNIEPISLYLGNNPSRHRDKYIRVTPLTHDWQQAKPYSPLIDSLELVRPYEEIAQDTVRRFLKNETDPEDSGAPRTPSRYEKLIAAEQALSFVLSWHESARQSGKRSGKEWAAVEKNLRNQLLDEVRLEQMRESAQAQNWDRVLDLAHRLADTYTDDAERERIFRPVADMIKNAFTDPTASDEKKQDARKRLRELEKKFPGNQALQPIVDTLRTEAQSLRDAAEKARKDKDDERARGYLQRAQETWPELEGLDALDLALRRDHPLLRVGVRGSLPTYFSPAWACTDNERRAVDLLFESLVKLVPDGNGGFRYRLALAESGPKVMPLGRQFELPRNARWSDDKTSVHSTDIDFSMNLLKNGRGVGRSRVWGDLLDSVKAQRDPFHLTISLKQGFLDPLALMTFKILPGDRKIDVNGEEFAKNPIASGPYRLDGPIRSEGAYPVGLWFVANPSYGLRATKRDAPHIEKIRLYSYTDSNINPVQELCTGKLDLVLDLTAKQAQELLERQKKERLPIEVPLPSSAVPNRRIYFLAINNHNLPDVNLRHALAAAINREALLDKHFRDEKFCAGLKEPLHRVINGPFPADSWACNPTLKDRPNKKGLDLFDLTDAKNRSVALAKPLAFTLKYPKGDESLDAAMKDLCDQVKEHTEVVLKPMPWDSDRLREDVEGTQDYDLAYYHYDFPDDSYWLAPLLGPPPAPRLEQQARADRSENIFRFTHPNITKLLTVTESYREFTMVQRNQWMIHQLLDEQMPFIPLWQLDPLLAYRRDEVKPNGLDPCQVFSNIEEWRKQSR